MRRASLVLLLVSATPAVAAIARATSVEDLARASDAVVRGVVQRTSARWSGDGRRILTDVDLAVGSVWRGVAPARIVVTVPGGSLDGLAQHVDAAPAFHEGEEVVAFLARSGGGWSVSGLALGKFRVEGDSARPDLSGIEMPRAPLAAGERTVEAMSLAELERRVREAR